MIAKLIIFLPLLGFLIAGISSRILESKKSDIIAKYVTVAFLFISAILSIITCVTVWKNGPLPTQNIITWISSGSLVIDWAVKIDSLTAIMLVVVTLVSSFVHLFLG